MTHTLTTNLCQRDFNATLLTDNTAMLEALVLTTETLVVLNRTKDLGAEKAVTLWLERTIVNCLRLLNLAVRPRTDHLG